MTRPVANRTAAVLFDLDGTLLDTAPDMVPALNELRVEEGREPLHYHEARAYVSNGASGLLGLAFADVGDAQRQRLHQRYLQLYAARLAQDTILFPGMDAVLEQLEQAAIPWGVVTNKPARLTEPLLDQLGLRARCACVVSGDTLAERKPHPGPLLHALSVIAAEAKDAIYVGDAQRDIAAGRAAGMRTVAAVYGYIPPGQNPADWGAQHQIACPDDLLELIE
jgi:phosphoglycolate phosphatase